MEEWHIFSILQDNRSEESQQAIVLHSMFNTTQGVGVRLDVSLHGRWSTSVKNYGKAKFEKKECFNISSTLNVQESSTFSMHKGFMIQT